MITSIQATNFRRHAELDLRFDETSQLILIAGPNGAGKSSILEILDYAFWGESRHGRRHLDTLVKRGSELEGMSVEVTFTVGRDTYRVHRRRDGKSSTAVLYCNDTPLVEGPLTVSEEISHIMGMDAAGFRLAVTAHQKDLDGLASLRPAERAQMITRLLRLDVLTAAKNLAGAKFRAERDLVQALVVDDLAGIAEEIADVEAQIGAATEELGRSRDALTVLDAELEASADVEAAWQACGRNVARLEGAIEQLEQQHRNLEAELTGLVIPAPVKDPWDLAALTLQVSDVEGRIIRAQGAERELRQRAVTADELDRALLRSGEVTARLEAIAAGPGVAEAEAALEIAQMSATQTQARRDEIRERFSATKNAIEAAQARLARTDELGAQCDTCGQVISDEHRGEQRRRLEEELAELDARREEIRSEGMACQEALAVAQAAVEAGRSLLETSRAIAVDRRRLHEELAELERRIETYRRQLERLPAEVEDLEMLFVEKGRLNLAVSEALEQQDQHRLHEAATMRQIELETSLAATAKSLAERLADLEAALPGADLQARFEARSAALEQRREEYAVLSHWQTELAVLRERLTGAQTRRGRADAAEQRRQQHQQKAIAAAAAVRLLGDTAEYLATRIRPGLEGAVGGLLTTMSEGRFTSVSISDEYNITVEDDGKFRPLTELSGGEVDLVALAVRLALSQIVSERHGAGGAGFLVLDECLGSQDPQRRQSILAALRNLREVYSQIFLISHVENIEDAADAVVTVSVSPDDRDVEVSMC